MKQQLHKIMVLQTKYRAPKILPLPPKKTDSKCRLLQQIDESIDHIMSACPIMAKEQCIERHDKSVCSAAL